MNNIIKDSISKAMSYEVYHSLLAELADNDSNSGAEKTTDLANYTKLNSKRMKRWDKTIKLTEDEKMNILASNKKITFLIITESWCGDAAHVIPVLNKIIALNDNFKIKLVLRDENLELMDLFLTNGGRAIAKVIMIDDTTEEVFNTYGPRPSEATLLVNDYKEKNGKLTPEFKEDLQRWYNKNKGRNIISDIINIIK